jgi:AmmeMemoRadiSam system protein A
MSGELTQSERSFLLNLARRSMELSVWGEPLPSLQMIDLTSSLQEPGASFVTLTMAGDLRGCVGALEPYQSLAEDVREHAMAAALQDYRFPPVRDSELKGIRIEISRLTLPTVLEYSSTGDLLSKLRPGVDGVILRDGLKRATFLPQVWDKVAGKEEFMQHLCTKMGTDRDLWQRKHLEVLIYQVEEFHE